MKLSVLFLVFCVLAGNPVSLCAGPEKSLAPRSEYRQGEGRATFHLNPVELKYLNSALLDIKFVDKGSSIFTHPWDQNLIAGTPLEQWWFASGEGRCSLARWIYFQGGMPQKSGPEGRLFPTMEQPTTKYNRMVRGTLNEMRDYLLGWAESFLRNQEEMDFIQSLNSDHLLSALRSQTLKNNRQIKEITRIDSLGKEEKKKALRLKYMLYQAIKDRYAPPRFKEFSSPRAVTEVDLWNLKIWATDEQGHILPALMKWMMVKDTRLGVALEKSGLPPQEWKDRLNQGRVKSLAEITGSPTPPQASTPVEQLNLFGSISASA